MYSSSCVDSVDETIFVDNHVFVYFVATLKLKSSPGHIFKKNHFSINYLVYAKIFSVIYSSPTASNYHIPIQL